MIRDILKQRLASIEKYEDMLGNQLAAAGSNACRGKILEAQGFVASYKQDVESFLAQGDCSFDAYQEKFNVMDERFYELLRALTSEDDAVKK